VIVFVDSQICFVEFQNSPKFIFCWCNYNGNLHRQQFHRKGSIAKTLMYFGIKDTTIHVFWHLSILRLR
jgi:hypothetical protein